MIEVIDPLIAQTEAKDKLKKQRSPLTPKSVVHFCSLLKEDLSNLDLTRPTMNFRLNRNSIKIKISINILTTIETTLETRS